MHSYITIIFYIPSIHYTITSIVLLHVLIQIISYLQYIHMQILKYIINYTTIYYYFITTISLLLFHVLLFTNTYSNNNRPLYVLQLHLAQPNSLLDLVELVFQ
jgi:hypothetical protein